MFVWFYYILLDFSLFLHFFSHDRTLPLPLCGQGGEFYRPSMRASIPVDLTQAGREPQQQVDPLELLDPVPYRGGQFIAIHGATGKGATGPKLFAGQRPVTVERAVAVPADQFKILGAKNQYGNPVAGID